MPEYKLQFTSLEYTAYKVCVEANSPEEALREFFKDPRAHDAEDDGFADAPVGMPESGEIPDTAEVVGIWESDGEGRGHTMRPFEDPVVLPPDDDVMRNRRYMRDGALKCPHCGSEDISGGPFESEGLEARTEISCDSCGKSWREVFRLGHIETGAAEETR